MKTVAAEIFGIDDNLRWSEDAPPRDLGRLHADACVSYLLGLPRELPAEFAGDPEHAPRLTLTGRDGQHLRIARVEPGPDLRLWVTDGEENLRIPEVQASYRVRTFIDHWGEETELTAEIQLPPEARELIADRERAEDETRRKRMAAAGPEDRFFTRPFFRLSIVLLALTFVFGLGYGAALILVPDLPAAAQFAGAAVLLAGLLAAPWLFFRRHEIVVDRATGEVREHLFGTGRVVARLPEVRQADVRGGRIVLRTEDGAEILLGREGRPDRECAWVAESVNDSIDLPAAKRKMLRYRREGLGGGRS